MRKIRHLLASLVAISSFAWFVPHAEAVSVQPPGCIAIDTEVSYFALRNLLPVLQHARSGYGPIDWRSGPFEIVVLGKGQWIQAMYLSVFSDHNIEAGDGTFHGVRQWGMDSSPTPIYSYDWNDRYSHHHRCRWQGSMFEQSGGLIVSTWIVESY